MKESVKYSGYARQYFDEVSTSTSQRKASVLYPPMDNEERAVAGSEAVAL